MGLTDQESRTYLALLKLQEAQTGMLCKETKIASSNIYNILDSLIKKGLVNYRVRNNIKIFMPAPAEVLNELFLEKQKKLDGERKEITTLIANLKRQEIVKESQSNYKYYERIAGVKSLWYEVGLELGKLSKNTIPRIYTAKSSSFEPLVGFYDEYHKKRKKLGIKQRAIFPIEATKLGEKRKKQLSEIKYVELKNDAEWGVIGDLFYIQYITGKIPRAFLIKDAKFAESFKQVFDQLWKTAKK